MKTKIASTILLGLVSSAGAKELTYIQQVNNVYPGFTSYEGVISSWGKPKQTYNEGYGERLVYNGFIVTFSKSRKNVNTIIVLDDHFIDINGLSVGEPVTKLQSRVSCLINFPTTSLDPKTGIVYWIDEGKIQKIVYGRKLLLDKSTLRDKRVKISPSCQLDL